jgi:hypothetical protein
VRRKRGILHTRTCNLRLLIGAPDCVRLLGVLAFLSVSKVALSILDGACLDWILVRSGHSFLT